MFERARAARIVTGSVEDRKEARERSDLRIGALGSGSDYTPFLQHLGVASLNLGYSGEGAGGSYHSVYDSLDHYTRFGDPGFDYGITLAQTAGRVMLRLANAEVLPFDFLGVADSVGRYVKEIAKLSDDMRQQTAEKNRQIREGTLEAYFDPKRPHVMPKPKPGVPDLDVQTLTGRGREAPSQFQAFFRTNEPVAISWSSASTSCRGNAGPDSVRQRAGYSSEPTASRNDLGLSTRSTPRDSTPAMESRLSLLSVKPLSNAIGSRRGNRWCSWRKRSIGSAGKLIEPVLLLKAIFGVNPLAAADVRRRDSVTGDA